MSIKQYTELQLKETSMIELAYDLLLETNNPINYHSLLKDVAGKKGMTEEAMKNRIANLYAEMSMDGRFVNLGDNQWGLRSWFPFDKTEEELSQTNKPRKKKRKDEDEEEEEIYLEDETEDFDEFEDLEDELDELANEEDEDEDFDEEDEDLDEDLDEIDEDEEPVSEEDDELL
ncbi:DNA-directed RNA polymerase subunit delta [Evansella sp. AB-P1]|uniref:DNA-directed RNA polymerase subunit delta n=1 Tax=Evansella sp. AB-P1 TaxID=3037653 RepID=UPI00241C7502|nr:DNA-directed RNA polymerase subunit delta [Evansella sp. AB-P1]MDG5787352.1 DNA-directed RNA polymerase subunit delta [Evansella sp. AB-P1]